ncbi:MAG: response regulator [Cytophagia bacterium]|nr:MAG: response regulator [Runella sp.]TAG38741.1 MAG: response regulator [Cytophagia bacterium]TAG80308.1 MAG: response regulator [Cytophagales bacterium]
MKAIAVIILFPFFAFFISNTCFGQDFVISKNTQLPYNLTSEVSLFKDSTAKLSLFQVSRIDFQKSSKDYFLFPYSDDVFWVKVSLTNNDSKIKDWILVWTNPLIEQLDFYISDSTGKSFLHKQQKIITSERDKTFIGQDPKFLFELSSQQTKSIYIKLTSKRGHYSKLMLHSKDSYQKTRLDDYAGQGFLNGFIFFRLLLVLVLSFFVVKDRAFRLYSLYAVIRTFTYWGFINIAGPLFTNNPDLAKKIDFLFYNSATLGAGLFILVTFAVGKFHKSYSYFVFAITAFNVFINAIIFFDYQWYWLKAGAFTIVFSSACYVGINLYFVIKKTAFSKYYAILLIWGLLSPFLLYIRLLGWIEFQPLFLLSYYLFWAEFFFFVFFLGRIFKNSEMIKNISEQKLNFNLEQNARLKELDSIKTKFFTNISHEFRTPLTLLVGPIDELQKKYPQEGIIAVMQRNLLRLQSLIDQLLDISKLDAGEMKLKLEEVDLNQFLNQLFASFESLAQSKNIIFNHSQSENSEFALFDIDKLEKIVTNLLSNAFKFTPENGRVSVRIDYKAVQMVLRVQDSGIGIDVERLAHIFDRFYQVDDFTQRLQEGTGIGLALVKELVDLLNGKVEVSSELGKGTTFTVYLPFKSIEKLSKPATQANRESILPETFIQPKDIEVENDEQSIMLIVEDNADLRDFVASIFVNQYQLILAVDGEDGLEKAIKFVPDIVISDLMMPRLDGLGLCEKLKNDERTNHIPVVMLTAKASLADRLIGLEHGADDYLSKPFNKQELQIRVSNLINQRQVLRDKFARQAVVVVEKTEEKIQTIDELFIQKAQKVINRHLAESTFDVEKFAGEMSLSSVQLRRKLKAITGQTITEFVRNYRLEIAAAMLKKGEGTVSEIAYQVGFDSMPYFSKVFQDKYGKTASEWE